MRPYVKPETESSMMDKKHKGAFAELKATAWLLQQGYEVFRNVSPFRPYNIIAIKEGIMEKIDVKTLSQYRNKEGELKYSEVKTSIVSDAKILFYGQEIDKFWWMPT